MSKKISLPLLALMILMTGAMLKPTSAAEFKYEQKEKLVEYTDDLDDDLYISGDQNVLVKGNIAGDLFVAAGMVEVEGDIEGTVYTAGGTISIDGNIGQSLFVAAGQVDVNGNVGRNIYAAVGTLNINGSVGEDAMITGGQISVKGDVGDDVRGSAGTFKMEGNVGDDLMLGVGQLDLEGNVSGDAYISSESVVIRSEEIIGDLVIYGTQNQVDISEGTQISGDYEIKEPSFDKPEELELPGMGLGLIGLSGFALFFKIIFTFVQALGLILLGWLIAKFAPIKVEDTLLKMDGWNESGKSFGIGFIAIPVGVFLGLILAISFVGWPTLAVLTALFSIASKLVVPIVGIYLGRLILKQLNIENRIILPLFIGVFLIELVRLFPIVGVLFYIIIFCIAIGAMLRMQYEKYQFAQTSEAK